MPLFHPSLCLCNSITLLQIVKLRVTEPLLSSHLRARNNIQGIIYSVWLDPSVTDVDDLDHEALFAVHREATAKAIKKAMRNEPTIDWLLENQDKVKHYFHELGVKGEL